MLLPKWYLLLPSQEPRGAREDSQTTLMPECDISPHSLAW